MTTPISPTDRRGFTLLELMLVVVVIGVVSALVFARIDSVIPRQRLRAAAAEIVAAVDAARSQARLKRTNVTLEYDMDSGAWALVQPAPPPEEEEDAPAADAPVFETVPLGSLGADLRIAEIDYSESGVASSGTVSADFRPSGAVGEHMVVLEDTSGGRLAVFVPALTGGAFIVDGDASYAQIRSGRRHQ